MAWWAERVPARWRRIRDRLLRRAPQETLALMVLVTLAITFAVVTWPDWSPLFLFSLPLVLGSLMLTPRHLPGLVVFVLGIALVLTLRQDPHTTGMTLGMATLLALGVIVLLASFRRSTLGVDGMTGESMLVDLRDRILKQGAIPSLPPGWSAQSVLRSAGGTPFAGDFVVAGLDTEHDRLDLALVDVSGKGEDAGTRALLLSGAFGGLLAALPPERFLPAANDFLLRQDWGEGFATAIHLSLDLIGGKFEVRTAGHPPAGVFRASSDSWSVQESEGPVLGVLRDAEFTVCSGCLEAGDGLLIYTDGMVESRTRDLDSGIRRLLDQAGVELSHELTGAGVARLVDRLGSSDDDRALVVLQRH